MGVEPTASRRTGFRGQVCPCRSTLRGALGGIRTRSISLRRTDARSTGEGVEPRPGLEPGRSGLEDQTVIPHAGHVLVGSQCFRLVKLDQFNGPLNLVNDTLSIGLRLRPKFKILDPIIVSDSVLVVNRFVPQQRPLQIFCHYESVLFHVLTVTKQDPITLGINISSACPITGFNRLIRQWAPMFQHSFVMDAAQPFSFSVSTAPIYRANV